MPGLVPGIYALNPARFKEFVDARHQAGHDDSAAGRTCAMQRGPSRVSGDPV
jgi:hypothetical protein